MVDVVEDDFGIMGDPENPQVIKRYTLTNEAGMSAQIITYGAAITTLKVPDKNGIFDDIVLGFDDIEGYLSGANSYFGAGIGRLANRVAKATFILDGQEIKISASDAGGINSLHGGFKGFDKRVWQGHVVPGRGVTLSYLCVDGEEGYPGDVLASMTFELTSTNELSIHYQATCTRRTPVGLTNHSYFNLSGHQNADKGLEGHSVLLNADTYTPVDETLIPTGEILDVAGTKFDFRTSKNLRELLEEFPEGIDHNFCLNGESGGQLRLAARVEEENNGRIMEIFTEQPGIQFYTGNFLPAIGTDPVPGKEGAAYYLNGAIALETQNYPDAINQANFPDPVLNPGDVYSHHVLFRFSTAN